jgi:hypothetical protein
MKIVEAPLWVYDTILENNKKILCIICELPNEELLKLIDLSGKFKEGILNQVVQIIDYLQGESTNGIILVDDNKTTNKYITNDEDILFLMFQKHYSHTTQTIALIKDPNITNVININNDTERFFKDGVPKKKYNQRMSINDNILNCILGNPIYVDVSHNDECKIKAKIL